MRQLHALDFDGVKLDGCGAQRNMTLYAELMAATGKSYLIENCHWGKCSPDDGSSCPTKDWCPFNWYRTSGDINSSPMSWYSNLQTTIQFQDPTAPLSVPGCWAYPDMLEVGRIKVDGKMNYGWNRAHFGAWCVVSAPLILGMDVTKQEILEPVVDIITNSEAIAVNQAWAGHPGALVWSGQGGALGYPAAKKCDPSNAALKQKGWALKPLANASEVALTAPGGGCLTQQGTGNPHPVLRIHTQSSPNPHHALSCYRLPGRRGRTRHRRVQRHRPGPDVHLQPDHLRACPGFVQTLR